MTVELAAQAEAPFQQALALHQQWRLDEARVFYEQTLQLQPQHSPTWHLLGIAALQANQPEHARELIERAILLDPQVAEFHNSLGNALALQNRHAAAIPHYDEAIELKSDAAEMYFNRGNALYHTKRSEAAVASFDQALALNADFALAYSNRGLVLRELNQFEAALASYDKAIALKPDFAEAHSNRGLARQDLHQLDAALADFDRAIALNAEFAVAYFNRAMAALMVGDFARGWRDYEWRWKGDSGPIIKDGRHLDQPCWLGEESIAGKTILLHSEQGLGDTLQFCRYTKWVADLGAKVILEVQSPLCGLLGNLQGVAQVVTQGDPRPAFDCYSPLMSLPLAFKTTLATLPAPIPYIRSDARKALFWKDKLGAKTRFRVGLVWSGGFRAHQPELWAINDRRNVSLAKFASLKHPDIEFYSLQKGQPAEAELEHLASSNWDGPRLIDWTGLLGDFSDTAALLEQLDLLISVDTSTAHLAN